MDSSTRQKLIEGKLAIEPAELEVEDMLAVLRLLSECWRKNGKYLEGFRSLDELIAQRQLDEDEHHHLGHRYRVNTRMVQVNGSIRALEIAPFTRGPGPMPSIGDEVVNDLLLLTPKAEWLLWETRYTVRVPSGRHTRTFRPALSLEASSATIHWTCIEEIVHGFFSDKPQGLSWIADSVATHYQSTIETRERWIRSLRGTQTEAERIMSILKPRLT